MSRVGTTDTVGRASLASGIGGVVVIGFTTVGGAASWQHAGALTASVIAGHAISPIEEVVVEV